MDESPAPVVLLGSHSVSGAYILHIAISDDTRLTLGRFQQGRIITFPAGEYAYIGSALGRKLVSRLLRHATRTPGKPPHPIRQAMLDCFLDAGLRLPKSLAKKRLRWHIDYLLESDQAVLAGLIALRSDLPLETSIARFLATDPFTHLIEPGIGAGDDRGGTHLLKVEGGDGWWAALPGYLEPFVGTSKACADHV